LPENTFITNQVDKQLKTRLNTLISCSSELKFLVGFFYFSGITQLYRSLKQNPDVILKVLVGLNIDRLNYELIEFSGHNSRNDDFTLLHHYLDSAVKAINNDEIAIVEGNSFKP
jgi:hypothetical protein